jgi:hypothetical protein
MTRKSKNERNTVGIKTRKVRKTKKTEMNEGKRKEN